MSQNRKSISINEWFRINAKRPFIGIGLVGIVVLSSFLYYIYESNRTGQKVSATNLTTIASVAVKDNSRELLEATIKIAMDELNARKILVCESDQEILSFPLGTEGCKTEEKPMMFEYFIKTPVIGNEKYKILYYIPFLNLHTPYLFLAGICIFVFCLGILLIHYFQRKFKNDILSPISTGLDSKEPYDIRQLEEARNNIKKQKELEKKEAVTSAILESRRKIAHNGKAQLFDLNLGLTLFDELRRELPNSYQDKVTKAYDYLNKGTKGIQGFLNELKPDDDMTKNSMPIDSLIFPHVTPVFVSDVLGNAIRIHRDTLEKENKNIDLKLNIDEFCLSSFACGVKKELSSIFFNLIKNSVEAIEEKSGQISIDVLDEEDCIAFRFSDSGKGIEMDKQKAIFERGATFNKDEGTGYGLYHAKAYLQNWKGDIKLISSDSSGTVFEVRLAKWKIESYDLKFGSQVAIVEDEERSQEAISKVIKRLSPSTEIVKFKDADTFINWISSPDRDFSDLTITMDYDLEGSEYCGLDLIEKLGIAESSYLLTDNFDDSNIATICEKLKIPFIPKRAFNTLS